jgi:hypothetical protein
MCNFANDGHPVVKIAENIWLSNIGEYGHLPPTRAVNYVLQERQVSMELSSLGAKEGAEPFRDPPKKQGL